MSNKIKLFLLLCFFVSSCRPCSYTLSNYCKEGFFSIDNKKSIGQCDQDTHNIKINDSELFLFKNK